MRMAVSADPTTHWRGREGRVWVDLSRLMVVRRRPEIGALQPMGDGAAKVL